MLHLGQVLQVARIRQSIQVDNSILRIGSHKKFDHMGSNKSGSTGN